MVKRERYAALVVQGVSLSEACRIVGINRRTGMRWRHGRTITGSGGRRLRYAPVVGVKRTREISARFLSEDERVRIADPRRAGEGVRGIARELGRDPATISRELRRNVDAKTGMYWPHSAQRLAGHRRARPRTGKLVADVQLREFVRDKLERRWSPEQIAWALRCELPSQPQRQVAVETIYQAVYRPDLGGLCRELPAALRTGRLCRRPRRRVNERGGRLVNMRMIDQRPREVADRQVAGHWEGDLITGQANRWAIGTWWNAAVGTRSCCTCPADTPPRRSATPSSRR